MASKSTNGNCALRSPSGEPSSPSALDALVIEHAEAFKAGVAGNVKRAALALGRPVGDAYKACTGELPTPLLQARRVIQRMLNEGQPERAAMAEFRLTATALGWELVRIDDWSPTAQQIANKFGSPELAEVLVKLFEAGDSVQVARSGDYKRGSNRKRRTESA